MKPTNTKCLAAAPYSFTCSCRSQGPALFVVWLLFLGLNQCLGQGTILIAFDGSPLQPPGTQYGVTNYAESGMSFTPIGPSTPGNQFTRNGGGISGYPDNGTSYLQAGGGDSLAFNFTEGTLFGLGSVDLAGFNAGVPEFTVDFIGHLAGGSTVTATFSGNGMNFQTFYFGSEWYGLTHVEIPSPNWSLDNLVVVVPEPGTWTLLLLGGGILAFLSRKMR